jgi:small-conductance mechanosensitive channel/CRP-like cAMP-binding protein
MKRIIPYLSALWLPVLIAVLFIAASIYQQEILVKLGAATLAQFLSYFPYVVGIGIWVSLAYLANRMLGVLIWDPLSRRISIPRLLRDVAGVLIFALAITGIVGVVFNKPIGPFWAASGAGAIVIGLALRNVILDIFIGLAMNFDRPFELGDFIQVANGPTGRVVELNWRTTRLVTAEDNLVVIPNGKLGDMTVVNYSKPVPVSEQSIAVCLDFEVDTDRALRVLNAAAYSVGGSTGILETPAPKARIRGVAAQGIEYKITFMLDPRKAGIGKARHEVWKSVLDQLHRAGMQPATPKQDVFQAPRPQRQYDARSIDDRVALLSRVELFQGMTPDELGQLSACMKERFFKEGVAVIQQGARDDSMYILFEGLLNVMLALKEGEAPSRVARLKAGMFFGEMSALTGEPRSVTVTAATDCVTFEITKDDIAAIIKQRPELTEAIGRVMAERKMRNNEAVTRAGQQLYQAAERSLAAELVGKMLSFFGIRKPAPSVAEVARKSTQAPF